MPENILMAVLCDVFVTIFFVYPAGNLIWMGQSCPSTNEVTRTDMGKIGMHQTKTEHDKHESHYNGVIKSDGVPNSRRLDCSLNRLFRRRS